MHRCLPSKSCTAPIGRPSAFLHCFFYSLPVSHSFLFILSFCLTMSTVYQSTAVEDTTPDGVIVSQCGCDERSEQSRSSQRYIAQCGCHEILIQRCRKFLHPLTITNAAQSDPVQNTTPEGVLSQCWYSLILRHSQPQWVYRMVRVPRNPDCTPLP